jgi:hypothetical protein
LNDIKANPAISIENSVFENGNTAVQNGIQFLKGCTFRNMQCPIAEGGALAAKIENCTFEGNQLNWTSGSAGGRGIIFLNCVMGAPKKPLELKKNKISPQKAAREKIPIYPSVFFRQSIQFKIVDSDGNAVPDAMINISCEDSPEQITRGLSITDAKGLTPASQQEAVIITTKQYTATDNPAKPEEKTFEYKVSVSAAGFKTVNMEIKTNAPIKKRYDIKIFRN